MTPITRRPSAPIPRRVLIASAPFGVGSGAADVAAALARGLREGGAPEPDMCPLSLTDADGATMRVLLEEVDFDSRMRAARAVLVAADRLEERALAGSVTFEIATRARQGGVPAYAVAGENALDPFDARMLDLQLVVQARSRRALAAAGRRLAELV